MSATREPVRVGVLDSGVPGARERWCPPGARRPPRPVLDHGALVADQICEFAGVGSEIVDAPIFERALGCSPERAAAGIAWLLQRDVRIINASVGLAGDSPALAGIVAEALEAGVWIVAATPIRGARPVPARYPGVISATGDARCRAREISHFGGDPADFGASPLLRAAAPQAEPRGGSSFACARVTGALARVLLENPTCDARRELAERAAYSGPQQDPRGEPPARDGAAIATTGVRAREPRD